MTVAKEPGHRGEHEGNRENHCVRECRVIPVYSLLLVCVLPLPSAHEAAGATGIRRSPRPLRGESFINGSGALRGEAANVCLMNASTPHSQSSSPAKEPVKDTDLILRSLRSKRLEGWTQRRDSRPSFETRARARSSG